MIVDQPTVSVRGRPLPDGSTPTPGGWNRIHFIVDDPAGNPIELFAPRH
jgi:hypothetical protein